MRLLLIVLCCAGCVHKLDVRPPIVDSSKWVEEELLPPHPKSLPLPDGLLAADERIVLPIESGTCDPGGSGHDDPECQDLNGILISEARAHRDAMYRIQYEELRARYEQDRAVWGAHRNLYERQIALDLEHLERASPSWWEQHDGQVLGLIGFGIGAAVTLGLAKAAE